jgi:hypothetical protein
MILRNKYRSLEHTVPAVLTRTLCCASDNALQFHTRLSRGPITTADLTESSVKLYKTERKSFVRQSSRFADCRLCFSVQHVMTADYGQHKTACFLQAVQIAIVYVTNSTATGIWLAQRLSVREMLVRV